MVSAACCRARQKRISYVRAILTECNSKCSLSPPHTELIAINLWDHEICTCIGTSSAPMEASCPLRSHRAKSFE